MKKYLKHGKKHKFVAASNGWIRRQCRFRFPNDFRCVGKSRLNAAGVGGRYGVGSGHVGTEYCFENERR